MHKLIIILLIFFPLLTFAQSVADSLEQVSMETDTTVFIRLEQVNVFPRKARKINYRRYSRIVAKIRKVYPFAKEAAEELSVYNQKFLDSKSEKERRKYVRKVEKELFARHEEEFKHFTISEGRYLMLLIDRESGEVSYDIIKELKGGLTAVFWQGVAKFFRNDLKERYDPVYRHYMIEQIVLMLEMEEQHAEKP